MPRFLLRKLFTETLLMQRGQEVKLCISTIKFSCTAFEVLLCAISLSNSLTIISLHHLYFFHTAEYVLTQKESCHEVFLLMQLSPAWINTTCLPLSLSAVDILVWIPFPQYAHVQRDTWPQHPKDWLLSSNIFQLYYFQSTTSLFLGYDWLHKLERKKGLRTSNKYCLPCKHRFPSVTINNVEGSADEALVHTLEHMSLAAGSTSGLKE